MAKSPTSRTIRFTVQGTPKPQPRPRAFVNKATGRARVYEEGTAEHWKSQVAEAARPHLPQEPIVGAIEMDVVFELPRPQRLMRKRDTFLRIPHIKKPDTDNLIKAVKDALTDIGMWRDDSQVYDERARKFYHSKYRTPGATITITLADLDGAD